MHTRIAGLLYVIANNERKIDDVTKAMDMIMNVLMPSDWVGQDASATSLQNFDASELMHKFKMMDSVLSQAFRG